MDYLIMLILLGQFGGIDFNIGLFIAFLTATFTSIVDSIADYYACARMARVPPPPVHALNRGIAVEGLMCAVSGFFGTGHGTTTYGGHIGSIGITRVSCYTRPQVLTKKLEDLIDIISSIIVSKV